MSQFLKAGMKRFLKMLTGQRAKRHSGDATSIKTTDRQSQMPSFPLNGFHEWCIDSGFIELLSDEDLERLNQMLPWKCFTADSSGRRFGNYTRKGKRDTPQQVPDKRIVEMNRLFGLQDRSVLEVGCFEGVHTIGLAQFGARVHAIDSRVENVVKTIVRAAMFGYTPRVFVCNLEDESDVARLPSVDCVHHVGVLYHLKDPVSHLLKLANMTKHGILLDTHYATSEMAKDSYHVNGREYRYFGYRESGRDDVFSGMYDHAKWILLDDIQEVLAHVGLTEFRVIEDLPQRNGPRVTLFAARPSVLEVKRPG